MKKFIKNVIATLNKAILFFTAPTIPLNENRFYWFKSSSGSKNVLNFKVSKFSRVQICIRGTGNRLSISNANVSDSSINIDGDNNKIILNEGVDLRNAKLIIRGNDCSIVIGRNSTFGGVRFVNVGVGCEILVGENCLFSDQVELWASDTHPIYNDKHEIINVEKPIKIGNKVWVGSRVVVLKGVVVGDGSILGMGAVITKNVPPNVISAGNPNRTIKEGVAWSLHPN